jgi:hypothetical protein
LREQGLIEQDERRLPNNENNASAIRASDRLR